jgi:DNA-binding winged helix-turn-helix (wHTH) protein/Tol biopolymer transport system component
MSTASRIKIGSWVASPALNLLENGDRSVKLEPRTMDVLAHLARRPGDVVSVEELLASVWQGVVVGEGSVYHAVKQLRQAFGADGGYIETIPKRGYRLTAPVEALAPDVARALAAPPHPTPPAPRSPRTTGWLAAGAVLAAAALLGIGARWVAAPGGGDAAAPVATRFAITVPNLLATLASVDVSPDGRYLAYVAGESAERAMIYVRARDAFEARALAGTEGATMPFWSPDGTEIGFLAGSELKRVALVGGAPRRIADIGAVPLGKATWSAAGDILFDGGTGIERVAAAGGTPVNVTTLEPGDGAHALPEFLPDGRSFLFSAAFKEPVGVHVQSLDSDRRTAISPAMAGGVYASGYLLLNHLDGTLTAQPFDLERLKLTGEPVRLAEDVAGFSVSQNGVLAYVVGISAFLLPATAPTQLAWYDRAGTRLGSVGEPGPYRGIALSRDGRYVAVHRHENIEVGDIWVLDTAGSTRGTRRTFNRAHNFDPIWSPDGSRIAYTGANFNLYQTAAAGAGPEQLLLGSLRFAYATDWSPDGKTVLVNYAPLGANQLDVAALSIDDGTLTPVLTDDFTEVTARFSPDGRWIAYSSFESGRYEVYVRGYPRTERQTRISVNGGRTPRWSGDGRELTYLTPDGTLMAVTIEAQDRSLSVGSPQPLFTAPFAFEGHDVVLGQRYHSQYDVSLDGERFLVNERFAPPPAGALVPGAPRAATIAVVVDWRAELEP